MDRYPPRWRVPTPRSGRRRPGPLRTNGRDVGRLPPERRAGSTRRRGAPSAKPGGGGCRIDTDPLNVTGRRLHGRDASRVDAGGGSAHPGGRASGAAGGARAQSRFRGASPRAREDGWWRFGSEPRDSRCGGICGKGAESEGAQSVGAGEHPAVRRAGDPRDGGAAEDVRRLWPAGGALATTAGRDAPGVLCVVLAGVMTDAERRDLNEALEQPEFRGAGRSREGAHDRADRDRPRGACGGPDNGGVRPCRRSGGGWDVERSRRRSRGCCGTSRSTRSCWWSACCGRRMRGGSTRTARRGIDDTTNLPTVGPRDAVSAVEAGVLAEVVRPDLMTRAAPTSSAPNVRISCAARARDTPNSRSTSRRVSRSRSSFSSCRMASGTARSHRGGAGIRRASSDATCFARGLGRFLAHMECSRLVDGRLLVKIRSGRGRCGVRDP